MCSIKRTFVFVSALLAAGLISGCLSFKTKPGGMEPNAASFKKCSYRVMGEAEGQASSFDFFWFFTVTPYADFNRAVSEAVDSRDGDDLIEIRWWIERKVYILGTVRIIHVRGTVIKYINSP